MPNYFSTEMVKGEILVSLPGVMKFSQTNMCLPVHGQVETTLLAQPNNYLPWGSENSMSDCTGSQLLNRDCEHGEG